MLIQVVLDALLVHMRRLARRLLNGLGRTSSSQFAAGFEHRRLRHSDRIIAVISMAPSSSAWRMASRMSTAETIRCAAKLTR